MATATTKRSSTVKEDPRLAKRRQEVEHAHRRRNRIIAGVVVGIVGLGVLAWILLHSSLLSVEDVKVSGAIHESPAAIERAAGVSDHPPMISVDPSAAAANVEALPWVKTATVVRRWPHTVAITVVERTPVATVEGLKGWAEIDGTGRVLGRVSAQPPGLIILRKVGADGGRGGAQLGGAALGAVNVAASLPPAFRNQVTTVVAAPGGTYSLQLTAPVSILLGPATQLTEKYRDIASVIAGATLHPGDVLNVSVPQSSTITGP